MNSVFLGALIAGLIIGAIPAIAGATKGRIGLGLGGFASCVVGSLLLGMILSIPLCAIFMYLIFKKSNENGQEAVNTYNTNYIPVPPVKDDIPEQIKKLADLKDAGILSESEFQEKKEQMLSKM